MTRATLPRRGGFTLVELLVAIAIAIGLMALAAGLANSGAFGSQRVITSSDRVSGWLLNARQRALRDGQPRGVRFFVTTGLNGQPIVNSAQYIEVPEPWSPPVSDNGRIGFAYTQSGTTINARHVYYYATDVSTLTDFVSTNDILVLPGMGSFRVNSVEAETTITVEGGSKPARELKLESYPDLGLLVSTNATTVCLSTESFTLSRSGAPRPLFGEPLLGLPETACIDWRPPNSFIPPKATGYPSYRDLNSVVTAAQENGSAPLYNPTTTVGVQSSGGSFDILFAPNGRVISGNSSIICLWLRDSTLVPHPRVTDPNNPTDCDPQAIFNAAGQQSLVVVYPKTGAIATQPINEPPATPGPGYDPYQFAKDGINTGL